MSEKHPYAPTTGVVQIIAQLRKSFPAVVNADTLKKLEIAPNNESYTLNVLKFLGIIDAENKKNPAVIQVLNKPDTEFQQGFSKIIEDAYPALFGLHGDSSWVTPLSSLSSFFRHNDDTSEIVGKRQANTFLTLARIAGKAPEPDVSPAPRAKALTNGLAKKAKPKAASKGITADPMSQGIAVAAGNQGPNGLTNTGSMALTVRVEINLPAGGDQQTYDAIFKSIKENLLNGNGV